ncbi:MAG: hypothetical protein J6D37_01340 [Clostridia bacterium]|nr:hypothetical protein [Clostridia bacterium]
MGKNNNGLIKTCAFLALALSAIVLLINALLGLVGGNLGWLGDILVAVGQIAMAVCVAIPAYEYSRGKALWVKILYWVALVIYVVSAVIPVITGLVGK